MLAVDEAALICDLAETYRIYDYRALPARRAAVFACGLRDDSRSKQILSGYKLPVNTMLLGILADSARTLVWFASKDGAEGRNRPVSILGTLLGEVSEETAQGFDTPEDFMAWRAGMIGGEPDG